ncbi:hypothetical protein FA15DRAFT_554753, partial [Coprinopsis marcescibilis]
AAFLINVVALAAQSYSSPSYWSQDYHTSRLTGAEWVNELIHGHPNHIWTELRMRLHIFLAFMHELCTVSGLEDSRRGITVKEQAAIFLY